MTERTDLIVGSVLIDNLIYADGSRRENVPGGAGLYALAGAALFSDRALLVAGTGEDLPQTFGPWLDRNGLRKSGLRLAGEHAPRNILRYSDEHTRSETPLFGHEHFMRMEPAPGDVERVIGGARSAYIFRNTEPAFWTGLLALQRPPDFTLLWEIGLDACNPQELGRITELVARADAFSLNLWEAELIFGSRSEDRLLAHLQALPVANVFLRAGARGSFAITGSGITFVPSLRIEPVDVTGGGNAYCGGVLVGLAEGRSAAVSAAMGTVAASLAIAQFGPPESGHPDVRNKARADLEHLLTTLQEGAQT